MSRIPTTTAKPRRGHRWITTAVWAITAAAFAAGPVVTTAPTTTTAKSTTTTTTLMSTTTTTPTTIRPLTTTRSTSNPTTTTAPVTRPVTTTQSTAPSIPNPFPPPQPIVMDPRLKAFVEYEAGRQLREKLLQGGTGPDAETYKNFTSGLLGEKPPVSLDAVRDAQAESDAMARQKKAELQYSNDPGFRKIAEDNIKRSREAADLFTQLEGTETRNDGVLVRVLDPGNGKVIGSSKIITVKVRVELSDGSLVKESDPNQIVTIATSDLNPALIDACRGMKSGAHWRVFLPPDKAYGLAGKPPMVGPNEALIYDIQLTGVQ